MRCLLPLRLLLALQLALALVPFAHSEEPVAPPVQLITLLRVNEGWTLTVYPDGSGYLVFGASDVATFPKGTVAFNELLGAARSRKITELKDPESIQVAIETSQEGPVKPAEVRAMGADWDAICEKVIPHLKMENSQRFERLLTERALLRRKPEKSPERDPTPSPHSKK